MLIEKVIRFQNFGHLLGTVVIVGSSVVGLYRILSDRLQTDQANSSHLHSAAGSKKVDDP